MSHSQTYAIISGVAKSGSTFLYDLLSKHPRIGAASMKETHFFLSKNNPLINKKKNCHKDDLSVFDSYFNPTPTHQYLLEASVALFSDLGAPNRIKQLNKPKIIFILREPAARIYSSFAFSKHNWALFKEDVTFQDFVDCLIQEDVDQMRQWMKVGTKSIANILSDELDTSNYYKHLSKWMNVFDTSQIKLVQYEKLIQNEEAILLDLTNWLDIDSLDLVESEGLNQNATQHIHSLSLHYYIRQLSYHLPSFLGKELLKKMYYKIQASPKKSKSESDLEAIAQLKRYYAPINQALIGFPEIDLSLWE